MKLTKLNLEVEIYAALETLRNCDSARVTTSVAKKWLLENKTIIIKGQVYHLAIEALGMGVYKVSKLPWASGPQETRMVSAKSDCSTKLL